MASLYSLIDSVGFLPPDSETSQSATVLNFSADYVPHLSKSIELISSTKPASESQSQPRPPSPETLARLERNRLAREEYQRQIREEKERRQRALEGA